MTEDEAKKKWCPFQRLALPSSNNCIASACMCWHDDSETKSMIRSDNKGSFHQEKLSSGWTEDKERSNASTVILRSPPQGHCGLTKAP